MKVPFTLELFFEVFKNYNQAVWPMQVMFYILALSAILLAIKRTTWSDKTIATILSFFWFWMGIVYHLIHFTSINKVAYAFGTLFVIQGMLFVYIGVLKGKIQFGYSRGIYGIVGLALISYALLFYPLLGYLQGRQYPSTPTFGLPCPTTIFTFGLLLWTNNKFSRSLLFIPIAWSIIGTSAALKFGIKEDFGLLISGIICLLFVLLRNKITPKVHLPTGTSL